MADDVPFDKAFDLAPDTVKEVAPLVRAMAANNPSPFTFKGTVSYIIGRGKVAILDPGPDDDAHVAALKDDMRDLSDFEHRARELCDRLALMHHGQIRASGTPAELKASLGAHVSLEDVFRHYAGDHLEQEGGSFKDVRAARRTARRLG